MEAGEESQSTKMPSMARRAFGDGAVPAHLLPLAAGLALRVWMLHRFFLVNGDSLIYGGLAKNLLLHGRFGLTAGSGAIVSTLIRLPGYPIFLALCFRLFGMENYFAAAWVQIALDLSGCVLLAGFARRILSGQAGRSAGLATLWLGALCPFTASYTLEPLTEAPTFFALALAMWAMARFRDEPTWANALWFTFAVTWGTLLRPDGALAAIAFAPALFPGLGRDSGRAEYSLRKLGRMAVVCVLLGLTPFAVWTARNWKVFHVWEPLAPRLANDPDQSPNLGWEKWVKSWCLDFKSTYEVYWNVPGDRLDVSELPKRAFDSEAQYAETAALARDYNGSGMHLTPELDARFGRIADERIAADPLRYYVWLPVGRVADMWLRPRVENLPVDLDWWIYQHHHEQTEFSWAYAGLNAIYLMLGIAGLFKRPRFWAALMAYVVLRSALLLTVEAPETRYTLECFPMLIALGGVALGSVAQRAYFGATKAKASLGNA
jgi:hypothetical protein